MSKEIEIRRSDLTAEPQVRQFLPNPSTNVDLLLVARRTVELERVDPEHDVIVFEGRRYQIRSKEVFAEAIHFAVLDIGQIGLGQRS